MATRIATTTLTTVKAPLLAAFATALGVTIALRLDPAGRENLLLTAAVCVAVGVALTAASVAIDRSMAAVAIAAAAAVALLQNTLSLDKPAIGVLIWLLAIAGIAGSMPGRTTDARRTLLSAAALAFLLPLLVAEFESRSTPGFVSAISAAAASVAFGVSIDRGTSFPRAFSLMPSTALWFASGAFAVAYTVTGQETWTGLTMLALAAGLLTGSLEPISRERARSPANVDKLLLVAALASLICAPVLGLAALASSQQYGWPLAGVTAAGFGSAIVVGRSVVRQRHREIDRLQRQALESRIDGLTSLVNRRGFEERLDAEVARSVRFRHPLSLLLIDVDDFKLVNDRFGHSTGDDVLRSLASSIGQSIRTIDVAARYGGEEFAVLLPETPIQGALIVAERIRESQLRAESPLLVTISAGAGELDPTTGSGDELIREADAALYLAKRAGKNRVEPSVFENR